MVKYIEREEMREVLEKASISTRFADIPKTADVRPERHGEWIFDKPNAIGYFPVKCSKCGFKIAITGCPCDWINEPDHVYCGACGAKMDGGKNNETD